MPQLIAALLIALAGFGSAWQIQNWRFDARELEHAQQKLVDQQLASARVIRRADNAIEAQNAATARLRALRMSADGARTALVGLHDAAAEALRAAEASHAACVERASAFSVVLGTVADAGREIAAKADIHASDIQMMQAAVQPGDPQ